MKSRARGFRRALCISLAAAGIALSLSSSSQANGAACAADALRLVSFGGQGAAGTEFYFLRFELRRPGHYTLSGYPGVSLLDGRHRLNIRVVRRDQYPPRTVQLDARHPAYFDFVYGNPTVPSPPCHTRVTGLRIIPPNDRQALSVRFGPVVCSGSVAVDAVRARLAATAAIDGTAAVGAPCPAGGLPRAPAEPAVPAITARPGTRAWERRPRQRGRTSTRFHGGPSALSLPRSPVPGSSTAMAARCT